MFYNIIEIEKKLQNIYKKGDIFSLFIDKKQIFPIAIKLKKPTQKDLQNNFLSIKKEIEELKSSGFKLEFKEFKFKTIGVQNLPIAVRVDSLDEFLSLINKEQEFKIWVESFEFIVQKYPKLFSFFHKKPFVVLEYECCWDKLLSVIGFLMDNSSNIYIREISLPNIDTKFIEKHKKIIDILISNIKEIEPLNTLNNFAFEKRYGLKYPQAEIRFRILDKSLYINGLSDLSVTIEEFKELKIDCKRVFIVENKITFLAFFDVKDAIIIFGKGYGVSAIKDVEWLKSKELIYWGDIDIDGFAILSQLRSYFKSVKSILMDIATIEEFKDRAVSYNAKPKEIELKNLTQDEQKAFKRVLNGYYGVNFRLEQEKIPFEWVREVLRNMGA